MYDIHCPYPKTKKMREARKMDINAHRLLYDNIHDFKTTALHVESEIERHGIRNDSNEPVPNMQGRRHSDMWASMKSVSHFNLGIAIELLLKMLLILNNIKFEKTHHLLKLYGLIPEKFQIQLESTYQKCRNSVPEGYELIAFINSASPDPTTVPRLKNREISTLRGFFEYFDEDVILSEKRYSWELINHEKWRHYLSNISVFIRFIDAVMMDIPR